MKLKDVDEWDHFKGKFQGKDAIKKDDSKICDLSPNPLYKMLKTSYDDIFIHTYYYPYVTLPVPMPYRSIVINRVDYPKILCEHEPIDVGFNAPKMVCKKCDKDL